MASRFREGTGTAVGVALASLGAFTLLAWLFAFLFWLAFSIYAVVELLTDGRPSAIAVFLVVIGLVFVLVLLASVGIWQVGKTLAPAKRDRD